MITNSTAETAAKVKRTSRARQRKTINAGKAQGCQARAAALELGVWCELEHNGQLDRVQLAWRSERGQLCLFVAAGQHSYLMQLGRVAAYLQTGLLRPQASESLTARATRDALDKLDANPERLLA